MQYRLRITLGSYGERAEYAQQFLRGFINTHPQFGPVVAQDAASDTMTVVFSLEADDEETAFAQGAFVFMDGAKASGLEPVEVINVVVSPARHAKKARQDLHDLRPA